MKAKNQELGMFGKPIRFYVDAIESAWLLVSAVIFLIYLASFWLDVSYLALMSPLTLVVQVIAAVIVSYRFGVKRNYQWANVAVICFLVGVTSGFISAVLALIRFWYPWLLFNLVTEPIWSGLLATAIGILTLGFFNLPSFFRRFKQTPF